ncbi:MAG: putative dipeptidase, partial [Acidimicrobiales bacterium]|nr:putative dipeptidase [Acidimicrobiales bacterium]
MLADRVARVRRRMEDEGVDVLLVSLGADLPYLTGYEAMPLERLTMLVLPVDGEATLVVPRLEAPRVEERPDVFALRPWEETEDPVAIVAGLAGPAGVAAVG